MKSVFRAVLVLILSVSIAYAQQAPRVISLDAAVKIVLDRNLTVLQQQNNFEGQQSGVTAAYGGLLPTLDASGRWGRSETRIASPIATISTGNSFSAGAQANLTLFNGFSNTANINRAVSNATASEQNLYRTRQTAIYQSQFLFLDILRKNALLTTSEDNLKRSQRQLEQITEMNKLGVRPMADVYRQQYQVGNDELLVIQANNDYEKAKADLVLYLGLSISEEYEFSDPSVKSDIDTTEFGPLNAQYKDFQALSEQALKLRPDYKSATENFNGANSSVTMARSGFFPSVSAFASYDLGSDTLSRISDNKTLSWGLNIRLSLFDGFQTSNQVQLAQVASRNAEVQLAQAERSVRVDIKKALLDLDAAMKAVEVSQKSVISANEDRKIQEEKYRLGASTLLDLLTANANYTNALSNKINAVYNYMTAKKNVDLAIGTIPY